MYFGRVQKVIKKEIQPSVLTHKSNADFGKHSQTLEFPSIRVPFPSLSSPLLELRSNYTEIMRVKIMLL